MHYGFGKCFNSLSFIGWDSLNKKSIPKSGTASACLQLTKDTKTRIKKKYLVGFIKLV